MFKRLALFLPILACFAVSSGFFHWGEDKLQARTEKRHFKEQNRRRCHPKGPKRFMIMQKATHAQIERHETDDECLLLTFEDVDPHVAYYKVEPNRNFGILSIKKFMWYCHMGRSMFSKNNPRGAMGYLSFELADKSGDAMHFNVFQLNKPHYDKKQNKLTYQISILPGFSVDKLQIENVILTIDLSLN